MVPLQSKRLLNFRAHTHRLSAQRNEDGEGSISIILCPQGISAGCKKRQNVLPKNTKIIAGGTILYGSNGKVSNGEGIRRAPVAESSAE
jgi:hypothetical protein